MEHHVYFWLKADRQDSGTRAAFEKGLDELLKISSIESAVWSVPAKTAERPVTDHSWTYAISIKFATLADHDAYQVCAEHDVFIDSFKDLWEKVEVKDLA